MFVVRPRKCPDEVQARQRTIAEFAASNDAIPLQLNWRERWCTLSKTYENIMADLLKFEVRQQDVFVVTFMKAGTTWMLEVVWLLMNNLDFESSRTLSMRIKSVFLDFSAIEPKVPNSVEKGNQMLDPRLIKLHVPASYLPRQLWEKKQKTIYVARNVKDVVVSSYHFLKALNHWNGNMDEYVEDFINDNLMYTPYWSHVVEFWKMRNEPFIFFVTYEEMKRDLAGVLQRLCTFLERPLLTVAELNEALNHLSFENMKASSAMNPTARIKLTPGFDNIAKDFEFLRRGIVGSYKDELTLEQQKRLDEWSRKILATYELKEEDIFGKI